MKKVIAIHYNLYNLNGVTEVKLYKSIEFPSTINWIRKLLRSWELVECSLHSGKPSMTQLRKTYGENINIQIY